MIKKIVETDNSIFVIATKSNIWVSNRVVIAVSSLNSIDTIRKKNDTLQCKFDLIFLHVYRDLWFVDQILVNTGRDDFIYDIPGIPVFLQNSGEWPLKPCQVFHIFRVLSTKVFTRPIL